MRHVRGGPGKGEEAQVKLMVLPRKLWGDSLLYPEDLSLAKPAMEH
jgi:hypothetical protein